MSNVLLAIEPRNPQRMKTAVAEAINIYREEPVTLYLFCAEPPVSSHVSMFFDDGELHRLQHAAGEEDLAPARALLDAAGVPYVSKVMVGHSAETIARAARELGCDRILMGDEGPGLARRVFGSLAQQVQHILETAGDFKVIGS